MSGRPKVIFSRQKVTPESERTPKKDKEMYTIDDLQIVQDENDKSLYYFTYKKTTGAKSEQYIGKINLQQPELPKNYPCVHGHPRYIQNGVIAQESSIPPTSYISMWSPRAIIASYVYSGFFEHDD